MLWNMCDKELDYFGDVFLAEKMRGIITKKHELVRLNNSPDKNKLKNI